MKKIIVNYEETNGTITNHDGTIIGSWLNLNCKDFEEEKKSNGIDDLIKLKNAGFEVDEILKIKSSGVEL